MAIADVAEYAHLSAADVEALAAELDTIRVDIEDSLGTNDRAYIQRTIALQRTLDLVARLVIGASRSRTGWVLGTLALAAAKSIENMELGHNIGHGQWDWMNDPEIHSTTWEWDMAGPSVTMEVLPQLPSSHVHQRRRRRRRLRVRRSAGHPRPTVEAQQPAAAAATSVVSGHFRMGYRTARSVLRTRPRGD